MAHREPLLKNGGPHRLNLGLAMSSRMTSGWNVAHIKRLHPIVRGARLVALLASIVASVQGEWRLPPPNRIDGQLRRSPKGRIFTAVSQAWCPRGGGGIRRVRAGSGSSYSAGRGGVAGLTREIGGRYPVPGREFASASQSAPAHWPAAPPPQSHNRVERPEGASALCGLSRYHHSHLRCGKRFEVPPIQGQERGSLRL